MYNENDSKLKQAYENSQPARDTGGAVCSNAVQASYSPPTLREQAEKNAAHHSTQADNAYRAAAFFRENPAFDEFIRLIRSGAVKLLILIVALALPLGAQTPKPAPAPKPVAAPAIPEPVLTKFWKAQAQVQQAEISLQNARGQQQAAVTEMQTACGKDFQPQMTPQGDPACVAKPAAKEKK